MGPRSLEGKWVICAQDWPSIFDEAKSEKYCIDFWVVSQDQPDSSLEEEENEESNKTELLSDEQTISEGFKIQVDFHVPHTFRPGVPFGGRVSQRTLFIVFSKQWAKNSRKKENPQKVCMKGLKQHFYEVPTPLVSYLIFIF